MTMSVSQVEAEYIASEVFKSGKLVTFHSMARSLDVHVNHAKKVLYEFYEKNKDKLNASFVITGKKEGSIAIKLITTEDQISQESEGFDDINTIHIYSVYDKKDNLSVNAIDTDKEPSTNLEACFRNGMLKGPELANVIEPPKPETEENVGVHKVEPTNSKPTAAHPKTKETATEKKKTGFTYVSRKGEKKPDIKASINKKRPSESTRSSYEYKSRKVEAAQPKERVIVSHGDDDTNVEKEQTKPKGNKKDLENLFIDDFSDDEPNKPQEEDKQPSSIFVEEEEDKKDDEGSKPEESHVESKQSVHDENTDIPNSPEKQHPDRIPIPDDEEERNSVPKEEVIRHETTADDDGYFTAYRENPKKESKPIKSKSASAAPKKTDPKKTDPKKSDKKKSQPTLMSFFSKK